MIETRREISACFTGHRQLSEECLRTALAEINQTVTALWQRGITHYYAGGALGFDLAASVSVLNLKSHYPSLTLTLALPCREHMKSWGRIDREIFRGVAERADEILYVNETYFRGCMQKRNCYMVDHSAVCIAYLSEPKGGTYQTVSYAERKGVPVIHLGPRVGEQLQFEHTFLPR